MKQGIVKFSKEFVTPTGLKEWASVELEYDMNTQSPMEELTKAKIIVEQWHKEANPLLYGYPESVPLGIPTELPVINKAEERLGILIENASTKEELMEYKNDCSTVYLADLWATKLSILNK